MIDERSGIIVMGRDVRVSTVAVAQGNLTVTISETPQVSQPNPLCRAAGPWWRRIRSVSGFRRRQEIRWSKTAFRCDSSSTASTLASGPRDPIGILQAIMCWR